MSEVSISYNGTDDVPLDQAVDEIFGEIQRHVNQIHIELRNLVMADDRGDDYLECLEYHEKLSEHVIGGCDMFKSVIKVSKQLLPKKPSQSKINNSPIKNPSKNNFKKERKFALPGNFFNNFMILHNSIFIILFK